MSDWAAIESEIVSVLAGLEEDDVRVLATVSARTAGERKALIDAIQRERMPAAYILVTGREPGDRSSGSPGGTSLSVLLATRSLRCEDEARVGESGSEGMWAVAERVAIELHDRLVGDTWRLHFVDSRLFGSRDAVVVWEQRYDLGRPGELAGPAFGGVALAGESSRVQVEVGALHRAVSTFSFPGIDGVFERHLGVRERAIVWRGQLRAGDDAALNAIEAGIEDELRAGQEKTMVDAWGRSHELCVIRRFARRGTRRRNEMSGQVLQDFEIEFAQLGR